MANCTDASLLPLSQDYYSAIDSGKLCFIYVDIGLTVLIVALFAEECYFVIKTYRHFNITSKSLWLITIYPVFAISSLLAVLVPRASYICDFVSSCFLATCLFQFSSLILLYFGHVDHLLAKVRDTGFSLRTGPCCCCCCCCPVLPPTRKSLITVRLMIFQTAILQPILQFISAVLWVDDKYYRFGINFGQSYVYLTVIKVASTLTAIYGLTVLHQSTQVHLRTHNTRPKLLALQLVQLFYAIQGAVLTIPARYKIPPCRNGLSSHFQMLEWHHLVMVVEMFLLSLLARIYYRRPLALDSLLEAQAGSLADIYTHGEHVPAQGANDAESVPSKDQPELSAVPQDSSTENVTQNNGSTVLDNQTHQKFHTQPADVTTIEEKTDKHNVTEQHSVTVKDSVTTENSVTEQHGVRPKQAADDLQLVNESDISTGSGTVNPAFDDKTSSDIVAGHCQNVTPK